MVPGVAVAANRPTAFGYASVVNDHEYGAAIGSPVVSLQALDPVFVEFSLPQQRLGDLAEGLTVLVSSDAYPGQQFEGKITAVNPDIDYATRNVRVQATLSNPDGHLRPGMFISADVVLARSEKVLLLPETAVVHAPFGDSVFVLEEGKPGANGVKPLVVQQRLVRLGAEDSIKCCLADRKITTSAAKKRGRNGAPTVS